MGFRRWRVSSMLEVLDEQRPIATATPLLKSTLGLGTTGLAPEENRMEPYETPVVESFDVEEFQSDEVKAICT